MITLDDLRKERAAAAANLKRFLEGDGEENNTVSSAHTNSESNLFLSKNLKMPTPMTSTQDIGSLSSGLSVTAPQLPATTDSFLTKPGVAKSVTFAPLPSQFPPSATTSLLLPPTTTSSGDVLKAASSQQNSLTSKSIVQLSISATTTTVVSLPTFSFSGQKPLSLMNGSKLAQVSFSASGVPSGVSDSRRKLPALVQSPLTVSVTSKTQQQSGQATQPVQSVATGVPPQSSQVTPSVPLSAQPLASSLPSSLASNSLSLTQATQASGCAALFNQSQVSAPQASLFVPTAVTRAQPSLLQPSLTSSSLTNSSLAPISQSSVQSTLFQSALSAAPNSGLKLSAPTLQAGFQPMFQAGAPPTVFNQSAAAPSSSQTSQPNTHTFLFKASQPSSQPIFQSSPVAKQPSLFNASVGNNIQSSLFQPTVAKPSLQVPPQVDGVQSPFFQTSMISPPQPTGVSGVQSSLFQPSLAKPTLQSSQPSIFQASAPSTLQTSQASIQPSLFQVSTQSTAPPFGSTLMVQATNSQFTSNIASANTSTFVFGQTPSTSGTGGMATQQPNVGGLFSSTQNKSFNFSAPPLQPSTSLGNPQASGGNTSFNFMQQNPTNSLGSGQPNASTFVFGQTQNPAPNIMFGAGLNQLGGGLQFQAPPGGNIFNNSKGMGASTPGSGRSRNKGRSGKRR